MPDNLISLEAYKSFKKAYRKETKRKPTPYEMAAWVVYKLKETK